MKTKPLVVVEWDDAWSAGTWCDEGYDACEPAKIVSVGFLLKRTPKGVLMAARLDNRFKNEGNRQFIPTGCITKYTVVKRKPRA